MHFEVISDNVPLFVSGIELTLLIAASAFAGGCVLGLVGALLRLSAPTPVRWLVTAYIEVIRNTPALVQLFVVFLGLPELGIRLSPLSATILTLIVNNGAYLAEIFRGGLQGIPRGQLDAAAALGLSRWATLREVLLPLALRAIYPALVNQLIQTVLFSSAGSIIGVEEVTQQGIVLNSQTFRTEEILIALAAIYLVLTYVLTALARLLGRQLARGTA